MKPSEFGITGTKAVISSSIKSQTSKVETKPVVNKTTKITKQKTASVIKKQTKGSLKQEPKKQQNIIKSNEISLLQTEKLEHQVQTKEHQDHQQIVIVPQPKFQPIIRMIQVNYSHYKTKFQSINNLLGFKQIDEKYCISFVFKGNFMPKLKSTKTNQYAQSKDQIFRVDQDIYILEIDQDEQQEAKYQNKGYIAPKQPVVCKNNKRVEDLTKDLKDLSIEELKSKGQKYRQLIEQRDLQDILFK